MSVYHYVANKDEILDGLVDLVFAEIELPSPRASGATEISKRARSAREVLGRHPWSIGAAGVADAPGPATLRHHDANIATLRAGGFSVAQTAHAYALLDAFVYGFACRRPRCPSRGRTAPPRSRSRSWR